MGLDVIAFADTPDVTDVGKGVRDRDVAQVVTSRSGKIEAVEVFVFVLVTDSGRRIRTRVVLRIEARNSCRNFPWTDICARMRKSRSTGEASR